MFIIVDSLFLLLGFYSEELDQIFAPRLSYDDSSFSNAPSICSIPPKATFTEIPL